MAQNTATLERGVAQRSGESRNMSRPNPRNLSTDFQATTPNTVAKIMGTCCTQLQELVSTSEDEGGALDETMHCLLCLCGCPVKGVVDEALAALLQLCSTPEARMRLGQREAVWALMPLLDANEGDEGAIDTTRAVVAANIFEQIALEGKDSNEVMELLLPAVGLLLRLVSLHGAQCTTSVAAAAVLRNMSRNEFTHLPLCEAGAIPKLVVLCSEDAVGFEVHATVAEFFANLAKSQHGKLIDGGAVPALVTLCSTCTDLGVRMTAADAIVTIARVKECRDLLLEAGADGALEKLYRDSAATEAMRGHWA